MTITVDEPAVKLSPLAVSPPSLHLLTLLHPSSWPAVVPEGVRMMEHGRISPLLMDVSWDGVIVTVTVAGELDLVTVPGLMECLLKVARAQPERFVLDLSGLVFVDVAGARALDATYTLLQGVCPVILRQPRPAARKVFRLTGLMAGLGGFVGPYSMSGPGEDVPAVFARVNHEDRERVD